MADNTIDLDSLDGSAVEETIEINGDVNPLEAPAPVDDGTHRIKLLLDTSTFKQSETAPKNGGSGKPFISCQFSGQVIAEGTKNNNKRVFGRVNTLVFDGKSEMAYIIRMVHGDTPEARQYVSTLTNYVDLAKAFRDSLASEPIIRATTKWVAQRKEEGKNGKDVYSNVRSGQKNFPPDGQGGYKHIILDTKTQTEVSARAEVTNYLPDVA